MAVGTNAYTKNEQSLIWLLIFLGNNIEVDPTFNNSLESS